MFISQTPQVLGQYYQVPDRQNIIYPQYPEYPQNGMIPGMSPMVPTYPYMQQPYMPYDQNQFGMPGNQQITPPDMDFEEGPPTLTDIGYTPAYLRTQIGRHVKIEFILGTNMLVDREGTLVDVGINYVIIREVESDDLLLCDMYSIKFVRFYY